MKKIIPLLLVFIVALGAFFYFRRQNYQIITPHKGDVVEAVYGLGKVKSHQRFDVIVGVISKVEEVFVDEGDSVKKGDRLIRLDTGLTFRSPFNGTVTLVKLREGEIALPQRALVRVENLKDLYIELSLEQQAALRVKKEQTAKVSFESLRGEVLEGVVTAIFPREDEFLAHVSVAGLKENILPGMTADVTVEIGKIKDTLLVPVKAVNNGMVTVLRDNAWVKEKVELGHVDGMFIEIESNNIKLDD